MKNLSCIVFSIVIQLFTGCCSECSNFFMVLKVSTDNGDIKTITPISLHDFYASLLMIKSNTSKMFDTFYDENKGCVLDIKCKKPFFEPECKINGTATGLITVAQKTNTSSPVSLNEDGEKQKTAVIATAAVAGVGASAAVAYLIAKKIMVMLQYGSYYIDGA